MEKSTKFGFNLPSRDGEDIADINQISDNFRIIDENIPSKGELKNEIGKVKVDVDQIYNSKSENPQSGIAVAEAINSTKDDIYNNVSNSLKSTKSGAVITADDVSPLEHSLKVKLTSDTVTDFSGVSVTRKGINLFNPVENFDASNKVYVSLEDDVFTMSAPSAQVFINNAKTVVTPAGKYTITLFPLEDYNDFNAFIYFYNKDGGETSVSTGTIGVAFGTYSYTFTAYEDFILSIGGAYGHLYNGERKFRVMLEEGTVDNPKYSAFVEPQTVAANKYGTVKGLTSASPMTLYSDNADVIIHCEYNKDINPLLQKKFELWQPNKEYKVGDSVVAIVLEDNSPLTVAMVCNQNHTSPNKEKLDYYTDLDMWDYGLLYAERANKALKDANFNVIHETYATKEALENISKNALELKGELASDLGFNMPSGVYIARAGKSFDAIQRHTDNTFTARSLGKATTDMYVYVSQESIMGVSTTTEYIFTGVLETKIGGMAGKYPHIKITGWKPPYTGDDTAPLPRDDEIIVIETADKNYVDTAIGNIDTALDNIIDIQNSLIGGGSV